MGGSEGYFGLLDPDLEEKRGRSSFFFFFFSYFYV